MERGSNRPDYIQLIRCARSGDAQRLKKVLEHVGVEEINRVPPPESAEAYNVDLPALHSAVRAGHVKTVEALVEAGADINLHDSSEWTPLMHVVSGVAVDSGDGEDASLKESDWMEILELMMFLKADLSVPPLQRSLLHLCAGNALGAHYVELLVKAGLDINGTGTSRRHGMCPLHVAATSAHVGVKRVVDSLVKHGADVDMRGPKGRTPLFMAVETGMEETVEALLQNGADPNVCNHRGVPSIFAAVNNGNAHLIKSLVAAGANVNFANRDGQTPLHLAVNAEDVDCVVALADAKADLSISDKQGRFPLYTAAAEDYVDVVNCLVAAGADKNQVGNMGDYGSWGPLTAAARESCLDSVRSLLAWGADTEVSGPYFMTPLHFSVCEDNVEITEALLEAGANVNLVMKYGYTPLHMVTGEAKCLPVLLRYNADLSAKDSFGRTPLLHAVHCQEQDTIMAFARQDAHRHLSINSSMWNAAVYALLTDNAASVNALITFEKPSPDWVFEWNPQKCRDVLENEGVDVELRYTHGETLLFHAIRGPVVSLVEALILMGANVNVSNDDGHTPLDVAKAVREESVVEKLVEAGAVCSDITGCERYSTSSPGGSDVGSLSSSSQSGGSEGEHPRFLSPRALFLQDEQSSECIGGPEGPPACQGSLRDLAAYGCTNRNEAIELDKWVSQLGITKCERLARRQARARIKTCIKEKNTELDVSELLLTNPPPLMSSLFDLQKLRIGGNLMTGMPREIAFMTHLRELDLLDSFLLDLPPEIGNLHELEVLRLRWGNDSIMYPTYLPKELGSLTKLRTLDLTGVEFDISDESFFKWPRLTKLHLRHANLKELPRSLPSMQSLEVLDVSWNSLVSVDTKLLLALPKLREFSVKHNPLDEDQLSDLTDALSNTKIELISSVDESDEESGEDSVASVAEDSDEESELDWEDSGPKLMSEALKLFYESAIDTSSDAEDGLELRPHVPKPFWDSMEYSPLAEFISKLGDMHDFNEPRLRKKVYERMTHLIRLMEDSPTFRDSCNEIARVSVHSCGDRVAVGYVQMQVQSMHINPNPKLKHLHSLGKSMVILDKVISFAAEKVNSLRRSNIDAIEAYLACIKHLNKHINVEIHDMCYETFSNVTPEDKASLTELAENISDDEIFEWLANYPPVASKYRVAFDEIQLKPQYQIYEKREWESEFEYISRGKQLRKSMDMEKAQFLKQQWGREGNSRIVRTCGLRSQNAPRIHMPRLKRKSALGE